MQVGDRVLLRAGGRSWWAALVGRAKLQRAFRQRCDKTLADIAADPDNYALGITSQASLGRGTLARATLLVDGLQQLPNSLAWWPASPAGPGPASADGAAAPSPTSSAPAAARRGGTAALQLKQKFERQELTAELAVNELSVRSGGSYVCTPLRLSVDLAGRPFSSPRWLHRRLGILSVAAPGGGAGDGPLSLGSHLQGALAVRGEACLWLGGARRARRSARAPPAAPGAEPADAGAGEDASAGGATAAQAGAGPGDGGGLGGARGGRPTDGEGVSSGGGGLPPDAGAHVATSGSGSGSGGAPAEAPAAAATPSGGGVAEAAAAPVRALHAGGGGGGEEGVLVITPAHIQAGLQSSGRGLRRLGGELQGWRAQVEDGQLAGSWLAAGGAGAARRSGGRAQGAAAAPAAAAAHGWSSFLPAPHFKVGGLVGTLARAPLVMGLQLGGDKGGGGGGGSAPGDAAEGAAGGAGGGGPAARGRMGRLRQEVPSVVDRLLLRGLQGAVRAGQRTELRAFASGGASLQVGRFRRSFLDYTRLEARVDLGLTSPRPGGDDAGAGAAHPAFALRRQGSWHALTLSLGQQLLGPVRGVVDVRYALEPSRACPRGGDLLDAAAPLALAAHVASVRPVLLDSAVGVDVAVPGSSGLVRVVGWWAPGRREGMLELRLL